MKSHWVWVTIFVAFSVAGPVGGHETDQFTVPPDRKFADLGPFFNRWAYEAIEHGVAVTNAQIRDAIVQKKDPHVLAELQSPAHVTMAVRRQWPWSVTQIETFEQLLASPQMRARYPGRIVAYGERWAGVYQFAFFPLDVRQFAHLFFFSSTIKVFGTYMGTDKLGHFTDEGIAYYFAYHGARDRGASEKAAIAKAVKLGTQGWMSEMGLLGMAANADYSNADLSGNFAGFLFYRNLTETVPIKGTMQPPMLLRDGPYWRMADDVRADSGFFARFISDHLDEALNPGFFDPSLRNGMRDAVRARRRVLLEHYCDEDGQPRPRQWFDRKFDELRTYWGVDYGHQGTYQEVVTIGSSCFGPVDPPLRHPQPRNTEAGLAAAVFRADRPVTEASSVAAHVSQHPLHLAAHGRRGELAWEPLRSGDGINARDSFGCTALHEAARAGSVLLVQRLLTGGADPNAAGDYGSTPLHLACRSGKLDVVKLLLENGANPNAASDAGVTPLHEAALAGDPQMVRLLLERGARADARDVRHRTPLDIASSRGYGDVAAILRGAALPGGDR
ncbi:MAG TPA: ankyrin repeat domain-containing protein [Tepidisphaeraceae bacterium]|nr:ankyrin repeat domain-containing protein [Tepidisphaeraceae bacterium]